MTRPLVVDSSAVVALLADASPLGDWVGEAVADASLAAPELVLFEATNVLRRLQLSGMLSRLAADLAYADLLALPLQLWPYAPLADRVWGLRDAITAYD